MLQFPAKFYTEANCRFICEQNKRKYEKWENVFLWKAINKVQIILFVQAMKLNEFLSVVYTYDCVCIALI